MNLYSRLYEFSDSLEHVENYKFSRIIINGTRIELKYKQFYVTA